MANREKKQLREEKEASNLVRFREDLSKSQRDKFVRYLEGDHPESHFPELRGYLPHQHQHLTKLINFIQKRVPVLRDEYYWLTLVELATHTWVRELEEIEFQGKSSESKMISVIRHLLVKYPIPRFLYNIILPEMIVGVGGYRHYRLSQQAQINLFLHFASGLGVKQAIKAGLLPTVMTAKMNHFFMTQTPATLTVMEAVRYAQIFGLGGNHALWKAICGSAIHLYRPNESDPEMAMWTVSETWIQTIFAWLARQPMLSMEQVSPMIDYLIHRKGQDFAFQLAGRNATNVFLDMERWHQELAHTKEAKAMNYQPSTIFSGRWQQKNPQTGVPDEISIKEILTFNELKQEGSVLRHCVLSYAPRIERGDVSIWSYRVNGARTVTLEVINRQRTIVQARGKFNRPMSANEKYIVGLWCQKAGLTRGSGV